MPWQVPVSTVAWVLYAMLLIVSVVGSHSEKSADDAMVSQIRSQLGDSAVDQHGATVVPALVFVLLSGAFLVGALAVMGRQSKLIIPLVAAGSVGVVLLAVNGDWATLPAVALLIMGAAVPLSGRAHRWLVGEATARRRAAPGHVAISSKVQNEVTRAIVTSAIATCRVFSSSVRLSRRRSTSAIASSLSGRPR